jgi:hypothetical protein
MSDVTRFKQSKGIYSVTIVDRTERLGFVMTKLDVWKRPTGQWAIGEWNIFQQEESDSLVLRESPTMAGCIAIMQETQDAKLRIAA